MRVTHSERARALLTRHAAGLVALMAAYGQLAHQTAVLPLLWSAWVISNRGGTDQSELEERTPSSCSQVMMFSCRVLGPMAASSGVPCA